MVVGLPEGGPNAAWERDFASFPPAGVIVFRRDFADPAALRALTIRLRQLARPRRVFIALDEEGGWVSQLARDFVVPPNAALLARGADAREIEWIARVTGRRLRALGFDWDFAPVADVHSQPDNPVIGSRAWGATPDAAGAAVAAVLAGLRAAGVGSCLKHFPGHGDTRVDSHLALPVCDASRGTLEARELPPFQRNLSADSVMTAHVTYPALDPDRPATFSRAVITDLLRRSLRFGGVCVTDALEMEGAAAGRSPAETGALAIEAGCDLLLYAHWNEEVRRARLQLADALVDGRLARRGFDDARERLARFDAARPAPQEELLAPLDSLTPPDWAKRLEAVIERGLRLDGTLPAGAGGSDWSVSAPEFEFGPTLADDLRAEGLPQGGAAPRAAVIAVCSRRPLEEAAVQDLRERCAQRPTVLVGLQNDGFLAGVPQAAVRVSACDATPLTRRVVARRIVALARAAAPAA